MLFYERLYLSCVTQWVTVVYVLILQIRKFFRQFCVSYTLSTIRYSERHASFFVNWISLCLSRTKSLDAHIQLRPVETTYALSVCTSWESSHDGSVGISTSWTVANPYSYSWQGQDFFSSSKAPGPVLEKNAFYFLGTGGFSAGEKDRGRECNPLSPSCAEVNMWGCISTPPSVFTAWIEQLYN